MKRFTVYTFHSSNYVQNPPILLFTAWFIYIKIRNRVFGNSESALVVYRDVSHQSIEHQENNWEAISIFSLKLPFKCLRHYKRNSSALSETTKSSFINIYGFSASKLRITGSFLHLKKQQTNISEKQIELYCTIPSNKFFFTQFLITTYIKFSNNFFRTFFRISFTFSISYTRTIILNIQ